MRSVISRYDLTTNEGRLAALDAAAPIVASIKDRALRQMYAVDLDRWLGPGGSGLSAGEAQLVSLARVWLRNPDLVVLDEATARVDPVSEERLHLAVQRLISGRTALVVAHRLSTLRAVDDICVFDAGRLVEFGTRSDLSSDPSSRYHRLLTLAREQLVSRARLRQFPGRKSMSPCNSTHLPRSTLRCNDVTG